MTIADLIDAKTEGRKIAAISCYDYYTASLAAESGVEMILVGDSAAQLVLGFDSTLPATMDFMVTITAAVRRGAPGVLLAADMPFLSCQLGTTGAIRNAGRFVVEAGAAMVKIEATGAQLGAVEAVANSGIAVMAHLGIRPQAIGKAGRFKAEATTAEMAIELISLSRQMTNAGAACLLLEGVAAETAEIITGLLEIPVIGCGSGPGCDGQILIAHDILGLTAGHRPKFAVSYADLATATSQAIGTYCGQVRAGNFPDDAHSYHMKGDQLGKLREILSAQGLT